MQRHQINEFFLSNCSTKDIGGIFKQLAFPAGDLVGVQFELLTQLGHCVVLAQCRQGYPCLERWRVRALRTTR